MRMPCRATPRSQIPPDRGEGMSTAQPMTDAELLTFCGLADDPSSTDELRAKFIATLAPERRALFDKMHDVELWDKGFGPKPEGVIVCYDHKRPTGERMIDPRAVIFMC